MVLLRAWHVQGNLVNEVKRVCTVINLSKGTNLLILIILAGDIEMNPGPRSLCRLCKKYCKASEKSVKCEECEKHFNSSCINFDEKELLELESGNGSWYCTNCKADCGICSGAVLYGHKAVQCDKCEMWIHNKCSLITESEFDSVENTNCTYICPKCDFFGLIFHRSIKLGKSK